MTIEKAEAVGTGCYICRSRTDNTAHRSNQLNSRSNRRTLGFTFFKSPPSGHERNTSPCVGLRSSYIREFGAVKANPSAIVDSDKRITTKTRQFIVTWALRHP